VRVLHYTLGLPPFRTGGLTRYSFDLMQALGDEGHEVALLYPGRLSRFRRSNVRARGIRHGIDVHEIVNPLPVPLMQGVCDPESFRVAGDAAAYERFLRSARPDVIHVHTLMGLHREFLDAARTLHIPSLFTTHDYFGICPKVTLFDVRGTPCEDSREGVNCVRCNANAYGMRMVRLMQSRLYEKLKYSRPMSWARGLANLRFRRRDEQLPEVEADAGRAGEFARLREYHLSMFDLIDCLHFNSTVSRDEYRKYVAKPGRVLSITHSGIRTARREPRAVARTGPLAIAFIGSVAPYKGLGLLTECLSRLLDRGLGSWRLHVYGDTAKPEMPFGPAHCRRHGRYRGPDLPGILAGTDLLVVPSVCRETFGFVGLEALASGVPVLASSSAGFTDLVRDGEIAMVFPPTPDGLTEALMKVIADPSTLDGIEDRLRGWAPDLSMASHARDIVRLYGEVRGGA